MATASTSTPWRSKERWACSPGSGAVPAASAAAGPISEVTAQALEASSISTSRPTLYIRRCRRTGSTASGSVSSQISPVPSRRTRMSACMWPLRSSRAA